MKISVITPTYNSEKTIKKNVESVLNQSYKEFEHIVIDNLSNDSTISIVKNLYKLAPSNLRIISEKDIGISDAFNKGIKNSTGDIITFLNSDDYYYENNIFENVTNIFNKSEYLIVHGDVEFIDPKYGSYLRKPIKYNKLTTMPINHPSMFVKREVYTSVGLFDTNYYYSMDFEFYCRLFKSYQNLNEKMFYFKKNPIVVMSAGGESWANEKKSILEVKRAVKKHNLINLNVWLHIEIRLIRTYLKNIFTKINFTFLIKFWRKIVH